MMKIIIIISSIVLIILVIYLLRRYFKAKKLLNKYNIEINEINQYLENISQSDKNIQSKNISNILNDESVQNLPTGIKGLIIEKLYNNDCTIEIDNQLPNDIFAKYSLNKLNNIISTLNEILDNAIEASSCMTNPIVNLSLYKEHDHVFINVGNNFKNNIDLDKLGDKYYSTKNNHLGLGLFSLTRNKIAKHIEITNNYFSITLEFK